MFKIMDDDIIVYKCVLLTGQVLSLAKKGSGKFNKESLATMKFKIVASFVPTLLIPPIH